MRINAGTLELAHGANALALGAVHSVPQVGVHEALSMRERVGRSCTLLDEDELLQAGQQQRQGRLQTLIRGSRARLRLARWHHTSDEVACGQFYAANGCPG